MSIITHTDRDKRLRIVFDNERTAPAEQYVICFEGRNTVWSSRSPRRRPPPYGSACLIPLLTCRRSFGAVHGGGREHYYATVYAGIQPTAQEKQERMRGLDERLPVSTG